MIKGLHIMRKRQGRMAKLLRVRKDELAKLPNDERVALQNAFVNADVDSTGTIGARSLRHALKELGLFPKTVAEKKDLKALCEEVSVVDADFFLFCFEAVPRARDLLRELRSGPLLQDFMVYDADRSGLLDEEECVPMVDRLFNWNLDAEGVTMLRQAFSDLFAEEAKQYVNEVDFDGFERLMSRVQEHYQRILSERERAIRSTEELGPEDDEHEGETALFFNAFTREATKGNDVRVQASAEDVNRIILEFGMMPQNEEGLCFLAESCLKSLWERPAGGAGPELSFSQFLWVLRRLRGWHMQCRLRQLRDSFNKLDRDGRGVLSMTDLNVLVGELGLVARSREDQEVLKSALIQVDEEGTGEVRFNEFQVLVQRVAERMASVQSNRERKAGAAANFTPKEVVDLRDAFYVLCGDGPKVLGIESLRRAVDLTRSRTKREVSSDKLHELLQRFDTSKIGVLSFEQFVHFMRAVLDRSA